MTQFRLSSLQTSHPIFFLLHLRHTELQSSYHLLIYFLIMFLLSHVLLKFIFLSWIPSSRFLFILAFPFLLQPWENACQPLLDIFKILWQMVFLVFLCLLLCVEVCQELRMLTDITRNTFRSHWKFKDGRSQSLAIVSPLHTFALHFTYFCTSLYILLHFTLHTFALHFTYFCTSLYISHNALSIGSWSYLQALL
jgi:hypothetical protein